LNTYQEDLWNHLDQVPNLSQELALEILHGFLELACQAQNGVNIEIGRSGIKAIPRKWILENIESEAEFLINLQDEWEFRRLLEVYWELDLPLVRRLASVGLDSSNPEIREASEDFLEKLGPV
jgi:hypothetical protein